MKTTINILLVCLLALFISQCEVVSEDLLQNPNTPSPDNVSPNFLLNSVQIGAADFFADVDTEAGATVRMYQLASTSYANAYQPQFLSSEWSTAYATVLRDVETLIPLANEREFFSHAGIARVIRAFVLINLVDKFGDVPATEAIDESILNPNADAAADVYAMASAELDSAIAALNRDELAQPATDLYYGDAGSADERDAAWIRLANTLKLKLLYQQRLVSDNASEINDLLAGSDMGSSAVIDEPGEEFVFRYSTTATNPDSRHPFFTGNYLNGAAAYQTNYYMNTMLNDKSVADPRIRYYYYRQVSEPTTDPNEQNCINNPPPNHYAGNNGSGVDGNDPFCEDWNDIGYWGRDHGNNQGIPPDNLLRTTYGAYPGGGRFDADQAEGVDPQQGLVGAGIEPMWMPFYTHFVRAEVELANNGDPAAARLALEDAVRSSISFVMDFSSGNNPSGVDAVAKTGGGDFVPSQGQIDTYVTDVLSSYDSGDNTARLNLIGKEFYLALFGNGIEAYNVYRRIAPAQDAQNWDLQPHLQSDPGTFIRSFSYPSNYIERNSNATPKDGVGVQLFWDTNPAGFADF